ncbi:DUF4288 domain-containing protein [Rhodococcoides fascians]|uniref:DUF4288 domain-containing protein n=1 Tax=Rhodococcoides fascians TaxID=1828 RepID=UPI001F5B57C7|nr:DUF4288 domain-containing protein [Rhodococcus fascians]
MIEPAATFVGMNAAKQAYVGIVVFELGKVAGDGEYYREDFYLVHAVDDAAARRAVETLAREHEYAVGPGEDRSYIRLAHVVDVARALQNPTEDAVDLYSRHFASLETYSEFEMMLGGRDPLAT